MIVRGEIPCDGRRVSWNLGGVSIGAIRVTTNRSRGWFVMYIILLEGSARVQQSYVQHVTPTVVVKADLFCTRPKNGMQRGLSFVTWRGTLDGG